jgi:nitrate reductase NapAB chaperone NapD
MSFGRSRSPSPTPTLFSGTLAQANASKVNVIIPHGLLLNLNYSLTMLKFNLLAKTPVNFQDQTLMRNILLADHQLKMGGSVQDFRKTLSDLFQLKDDIDETTFDAAWSAMLGDLNKLKITYQSLKQQNQDKQITLTSGTNSIHINAISRAVADPEAVKKDHNPLKLDGMDCYVSYLQKPIVDLEKEKQLLRSISTDESLVEKLVEHIAPLREIATNTKSHAGKTVVVLELTSELLQTELQMVQDSNNQIALAKKIWAEQQGFIVAPFDRRKVTAEKDAVAVITESINQALLGMKEEARSAISFNA